MEPTPTHHRTTDIHESFVDVVAFVEAGAEASELVQESDGLLNDISEDAKAAAVGLAPVRDYGFNATAAERHLPVRVVVGAVGHHLLRLAQRSASLSSNRFDGVNQGDQLRHVVAAGGGEDAGQGDAVGVDRQVVLGAVFASIHGAGPRFFPPCTARTDDESIMTREKSISSAPRSLSNSRRCRRSQTPAWRHSLRRFHSVMPQQPISWGKSSQGRPVLSTKMIPVKQIRSGTRGLPTPGTYGCLGKRGSTKAQSSSGTNGLLIVSSMTATPNIVTERFRRSKDHFY